MWQHLECQSAYLNLTKSNLSYDHMKNLSKKQVSVSDFCYMTCFSHVMKNCQDSPRNAAILGVISPRS